MLRRVALVAAIALPLPSASAAAQTLPLISFQDLALEDEDLPRLTDLLGVWAELVRPVADTAWDPLESIRRPSTHAVVPPDAVYDRACSTLVGEAVFTVGAEPAPEEMAELTNLRMRHAALELTARETPAAPARSTAQAAGATSIAGIIEGVLAGQGLAEALGAGEESDALLREGMRVQQGVESGPSLRLAGRIDDWYVEQGFTYDGWATQTGDERDGSTLVWSGDDAAEDVKISLHAFNHWASHWPMCAHLPRGPVITITLRDFGPDGPWTLVRSLETQRLATLGDQSEDHPLTRRFRAALQRHDLDWKAFHNLLLATTDAAWLARNPGIREAMLGEARRDAANPFARMVMQHVDNSRWFERHRAELEPALAAWRAAFGTER